MLSLITAVYSMTAMFWVVRLGLTSGSKAE